MNFIITRPEHDYTTRYISYWSKKIIELAKNKNINVCDLNKNKANKKELIGRIKKLNPEFVMLNGHGDDNLIKGHDNEVLIQTNNNEQVLESRITYSLSCNSAKKLGPKVVKKEKTTTFIGYQDEFIFVFNRECISNPLNDKSAEPFMEASNQIAVSLFKNHSTGESCERSKKIFENNYYKLLSSDSTENNLLSAQCLWWNMNNQVCLGNKDKKIIGIQ